MSLSLKLISPLLANMTFAVLVCVCRNMDGLATSFPGSLILLLQGQYDERPWERGWMDAKIGEHHGTVNCAM